MHPQKAARHHHMLICIVTESASLICLTGYMKKEDSLRHLEGVCPHFTNFASALWLGNRNITTKACLKIKNKEFHWYDKQWR